MLLGSYQRHFKETKAVMKMNLIGSQPIQNMPKIETFSLDDSVVLFGTPFPYAKCGALGTREMLKVLKGARIWYWN
jgi:hypothetical protein